jgi:hypothetical protein
MELNTIYLICAVAGGTVLVLRIILMAIGLDHNGADTDVPHDLAGHDIHLGDHGGDVHDGTVNLISIQSISSFFTMFGLVGMGLLQVKAAPLWSLAGALGAGLLTAWATAMIVFSLQKLQSEGTMNIMNAIGQQGSVYLTIPEQGTGVVNVTVQGAQRQFDAISAQGEKIPTGKMVKVTGVTGGKLLVEVDRTIADQI